MVAVYALSHPNDQICQRQGLTSTDRQLGWWPGDFTLDGCPPVAFSLKPAYVAIN